MHSFKRMGAMIVAAICLFAMTGCSKKDETKKTKAKDDENVASVSNDDDKSSDDSKATENKDDKDDKKGEKAGSGTIIGYISDKSPLPAGSQAHDYWHAVESQHDYEFDKDGKCTVYDTIYYLDDPSNYESANSHLTESGFTPDWSDDKSFFRLEGYMKEYTDLEDALEDMEKNYYAYSIKYSDGTTEHVDAPTEEKKLEDMKNNYGFTFEDVKDDIGDFTYSGWYRDKAEVLHGTNQTIDDVNALIKKLWDVCYPIADEGKMYTYMGKYGDEITEAPVITSEFDTAEFHYFKDGKEIKVAVTLSIKNDNALAFFVGIVT